MGALALLDIKDGGGIKGLGAGCLLLSKMLNERFGCCTVVGVGSGVFG